MILLDLYLKELGVEPNIDSKDKRIILQKAVYLGQAAGADLGYRYSWYLNGPYSSELTRDYYRLFENTETPGSGHDFELQADFKRALDSVKPFMVVPRAFTKGKPLWLELVSSLDYAMRVLRKSKEDAAAFVQREKPHLAEFTELGLSALSSSAIALNGQ